MYWSCSSRQRPAISICDSALQISTCSLHAPRHLALRYSALLTAASQSSGLGARAHLQVRSCRHDRRRPRAIAGERPRAVPRERTRAVGAARRARGAGCRWARVGVTAAPRAPGCGRRARRGLRRGWSRAQGLRLPRLRRLVRSALCYLLPELPACHVQSLTLGGQAVGQRFIRATSPQLSVPGAGGSSTSRPAASRRHACPPR